MNDKAPVQVLIVDDEVAQMKALCNTLGDRGYVTTGFSSGREAIAVLETRRFDLLLTDLMMPEMDGIALMRAARARDPELVGIVMTGQGTIDTAVEAMKAGALDYILKPFKLSIILPVLARAMAVRRLRIENAELTAGLQERTVALEAANRELETFSYSVAHDLRAPLRTVSGFANLLQNDFSAQLPEEARRLLGHVASGARRMGEIIDDLLRLSELGRRPLIKAPLKLAPLVAELVEDLKREQPERQVEVVLGELPDSMGDLSLVRQVFVNLLSNGFKFTRRRAQARIEVGTETRDSEVVYFVRDNGAGFDMRFADRLFGVFQRMHKAEDFEGSGIGLSIVQRIILRHGGRIWAEAAPDKGATFRFTLGSAGDHQATPALPPRFAPLASTLGASSTAD